MPNIRPLDKKDFKQVVTLFSQLTSNPTNFDGEEVLRDINLNCIIIEENNTIIGFGSLIIHRVPVRGRVARIEDVVIDSQYRGRGYGKMLTRELLKIAKDKNIHEINLTSKPERVAARKLYESMGFKLLDTGVFLLKL